MADNRMIFQRDWYEDIVNDKFVPTTDQEIAYLLYAAMKYSFYDEQVNLGEVFGKEFANLNRSMTSIYGQIDKIKNYGEEKKASVLKYDADRIYELRLEGYTAKEICIMEGYGEDKANNITSNKGWKLAGEELKKRKVQKSGNSVKSVSESVQNNTDSMERNFDF